MKVALVGLVVLVVAFLLRQRQAEDEDRPPIIVRGGSVIFESGDSRPATKKKGKDWKNETVGSESQWKPDHKKGRPITGFHLSFVEGTTANTACAAADVSTLTVVYDDDGSPTTPPLRHEIAPRPRENGKGTPAPTIIVDKASLTQHEQGKDHPRLEHGTPKTFDVEYIAAGTPVVCILPTLVIVESKY